MAAAALMASGGLTEDQVHDAVRIASVVNAAAVSLELADVPPDLRVAAAE